MTREEHIENLKAIASDMPSDKCSDWIESLMAGVKALEQEPCGDCISRQAVLKAIEDDNRNEHYSCFATNNDAECFKLILRELPSVTPQPCEDCISRQAAINAAIEAADEWDGGGNRNREKIIEKALEQLPSVTAQPKIGYWEWLQYDGNTKIGNWHCSECRTIVPRIPEVDNTPIYKWCPMCGAKMSEIPTGAEGSEE